MKIIDILRKEKWFILTLIILYTVPFFYSSTWVLATFISTHVPILGAIAIYLWWFLFGFGGFILPIHIIITFFRLVINLYKKTIDKTGIKVRVWKLLFLLFLAVVYFSIVFPNSLGQLT